MCSEALMSTEIVAIQTKNAPQAIGPYSQAIKVKNVQETLYISGQLPLVPETGVLITDPAQAIKQCMMNIEAILKEADMDFANIVDVLILLTDMDDFSVINKVYESFFKKPYPARATFQVAALPKDACIEIKITAIK